MQYLPLGRSGVKVSRLCLGTVNFGPQTPEPEARDILDAAVEAGVNFIDTADTYGKFFTRPDVGGHPGWTEEILGRWLKDRPGRRDRIVLATKCYIECSPDINDRGLSAFHIRRAAEGSLRRLGVDHVDLYQMHHVDRQTPWDEVWQALETLIRQGKITYVGSSNFAGWDIATACQIARQRGLMSLVCEQSKYGLLCRTPELEVLPACRHYGLGAIAWSPLNNGLLAGIESLDEIARRGDEGSLKNLERHRPKLERYESLCRRTGQKPAQVGLAWVLANPDLTGPIIGPRTIEHLHDALAAVELRLDAQTLAELDAIFPGPGGEAPQAYAW
ncbi:MAG: aldo/keto reductase [Phycisphaeraceae bacterium]|nr:aldo/keto reductase [Phycisphaeraceae bacterium]